MTDSALKTHRLQPLLAPHSVALVGASRRFGSAGEMTVRSLVGGSYAGKVYPVNPRYTDLSGVPCYASLGELAETVDLAVLNLAGHRIEAAVKEAISPRVKALVLFDPCVLPEEVSPTLVERLSCFGTRR